MAQPTVIPFGAGRFWLGDGASPEVFSAPCGLTQGDLTIDKDTNDVTVPDCDDPDAPAWKATDVVALGWSITAQGVIAKEAMAAYDAAVFSSKSVGTRLELKGLGTGAGTPDRRYQGKGHVKYKITGERGNKWQIQIDITGDGELAVSSIAVA